jgi:hypothetical protein
MNQAKGTNKAEYKTYEFDRTGRITIYPSLKQPAGKGPRRVVQFFKKLLLQRRGAGKGSH